MNKVATLLRLLNEKGLAPTVEAISDHYIEKYAEALQQQRNLVSKFLFIQLLVIEQVHLMLTEAAIACSANSNKWIIFDLRRLKESRSIISIFDRVSGTRHGSEKHLRMMENIYTYEGFVEVEKGDIIVDVGAYVGAFSIAASKDASKIFAIDPLAKISSALDDNVSDIDNISVIAKAAWNEAGSIEINQSFFPADDSILKPDQYGVGSSFCVETETVPNMIGESGITTVDYLKIEAEGAEPEIIKACLESQVIFRKIAIDVSEKRQSKEVEKTIARLLVDNGYNWKMKSDSPWWGDKIIFARED